MGQGIPRSNDGVRYASSEPTALDFVTRMEEGVCTFLREVQMGSCGYHTICGECKNLSEHTPL